MSDIYSNLHTLYNKLVTRCISHEDIDKHDINLALPPEILIKGLNHYLDTDMKERVSLLSPTRKVTKARKIT